MFSRFRNFYEENDDVVANAKLEEVLNAIQNKDKEKLKSLFSENALSKVKDFDYQMEELFDYYEGTCISYDDGAGTNSSETIDFGVRQKELYPKYEVMTNICNYRLTMKIISVDDNLKNIGIWSIYIIKSEDDPDSYYAYFGDNKYTPGISINVKNHID